MTVHELFKHKDILDYEVQDTDNPGDYYAAGITVDSDEKRVYITFLEKERD